MGSGRVHGLFARFVKSASALRFAKAARGNEVVHHDTRGGLGGVHRRRPGGAPEVTSIHRDRGMDARKCTFALPAGQKKGQAEGHRLMRPQLVEHPQGGRLLEN